MTQAQAAEAFGLSTNGYAKIERGKRKLAQHYIELACEIFGADASEVLLNEAREAANAIDGLSDSRSMEDDQSRHFDQALFGRLILAARERLGDLPEEEARNLVEALLAASRRPKRRP